jgi:preprotein translocase subunit SecG
VILLIGAIMMQKTGSDSLAGLSGSSNPSTAPRSTGNIMSKITFILAFCFMANCLIIGNIINKQHKKSNAIAESIVKNHKKKVFEAPEVSE